MENYGTYRILIDENAKNYQVVEIGDSEILEVAEGSFTSIVKFLSENEVILEMIAMTEPINYDFHKGYRPASPEEITGIRNNVYAKQLQAY